MKKIFSIDRIEGDVAVCISDDDVQIELPLSLLAGMKVRDVFSADLDGESVTNVVPMPEERDRRLASNRERLLRLLNRNKQS